MSILVVDAGTSGIRAAVIRPDATVAWERHTEVLPDSPAAGLVEFDADHYVAVALDLARAALAEAGPVEGVGISNQRGSTIVWDADTGRAVAPAQGWQDLRTVGDCLVLAAEGIRVAPNQSATKAANILTGLGDRRPARLRVGTPDTWLTWHLTDGTAHVTDLSNAAITGLLHGTDQRWDPDRCSRLGVEADMLPAIVDSSGEVAVATALDGAPPICGIAGDQQASLIGQGCVRPGLTKVTFGSGGMLDTCVGTDAPATAQRSPHGTFPIVCWRLGGEVMWGLEAIMLSAGTNVQWLRDDLGLLASVEDSARVAGGCDDTGGVVYVPAQLGLGTPQWDYGARGGLFGVTRGTSAPQVVRAVLEGVAHRGTDLIEAAEAETGRPIDRVRVDGGMSSNPVFTQALADASGRVVEVAPVKEATTLGAAFLAGLALDTWSGWDDVAATWSPAAVVEPAGALDREQWARAVTAAGGWFEDLSALDF